MFSVKEPRYFRIHTEGFHLYKSRKQDKPPVLKDKWLDGKTIKNK